MLRKQGAQARLVGPCASHYCFINKDKLLGRSHARTLPQQPSSYDGRQKSGLSGVAGQGEEELRLPKLFVHAHGDPFLGVEVGLGAGNVPQSGVHSAAAVLVTFAVHGLLLPSHANIHVA